MKKLLLFICLSLPVSGIAAICEITDTKLCDKAKQGDAKAQAKVGEMYFIGKGVHPNNKIAKECLDWLEKSAAQNNIDAMLFLAGYEKGQGDHLRAKKWYGKACDNGSLKGCQNK